MQAQKEKQAAAGKASLANTLHLTKAHHHGNQINLHSSIQLVLVMGPGQKFLTRVGSGQFFVARVGSAIYGLG